MSASPYLNWVWRTRNVSTSYKLKKTTIRGLFNVRNRVRFAFAKAKCY
ncbi:hypothetical protein NMS_1509 [Nonlabens marinus S1-08]|uniref:Uncharacterized protein n=1 Tax=Nonlabens marinus S1-08 TaxID=1454201 RepID=W8VVK1_9FLAO|nr:hypothetical protein NMS_1509 [Nonlabens marinus S1-08]